MSRGLLYRGFITSESGGFDTTTHQAIVRVERRVDADTAPPLEEPLPIRADLLSASSSQGWGPDSGAAALQLAVDLLADHLEVPTDAHGPTSAAGRRAVALAGRVAELVLWQMPKGRSWRVTAAQLRELVELLESPSAPVADVVRLCREIAARAADAAAIAPRRQYWATRPGTPERQAEEKMAREAGMQLYELRQVEAAALALVADPSSNPAPLPASTWTGDPLDEPLEPARGNCPLCQYIVRGVLTRGLRFIPNRSDEHFRTCENFKTNEPAQPEPITNAERARHLVDGYDHQESVAAALDEAEKRGRGQAFDELTAFAHSPASTGTVQRFLAHHTGGLDAVLDQAEQFAAARAAEPEPTLIHLGYVGDPEANVNDMQAFLEHERKQQQRELHLAQLDVDFALLETTCAAVSALRAAEEGYGADVAAAKDNGARSVPVPTDALVALRLKLETYEAASDAYLERALAAARGRRGSK